VADVRAVARAELDEIARLARDRGRTRRKRQQKRPSCNRDTQALLPVQRLLICRDCPSADKQPCNGYFVCLIGKQQCERSEAVNAQG
jgi:hypothetical protein